MSLQLAASVDHTIMKAPPKPLPPRSISNETLMTERKHPKHRKRDKPPVQLNPQRVLKFVGMTPEDENDLDNPNVDFLYPEQAGAGVRVYVVDSGANPRANVSVMRQDIVFDEC